MKKINTLFVTGLCLLINYHSIGEKRKILFIGNSYIGVNDLPNTLKSLALSMGDTLEIDSNTPGGMTLNGHTTDVNTLAKIQIGGWDYVVIQAQSQEPSFDPSQVASNTYPYAKKLDSLIHVSNPCAETIFYMTWGRKNGDALNCAVYPPVCTYAGMQQRLRESYLEMSMTNNSTCAPVGVAWKKVRDTYPLIELYNADESHPSLNGTYLVACTFYSTIYHKSSLGASYILSGVLASDATNLQTVASNTVLDSIENWQQYGTLPKANYLFTNNQNVYSFNNLSMRSTQYEWNFGDGSAVSMQANPTHTYTSIGSYTVALKSKNSCGKYDTFNKTVQINLVPNFLENEKLPFDLNIYYANGFLFINNEIEANQIEIFNANGALIKKLTLDSLLNKIWFRPSSGVYFYAIKKQHKTIETGKFEVR